MVVRGEGEQAIWLNFGNKFLLLFSVRLARKCVWVYVCVCLSLTFGLAPA